ncbi:transcriptional regulator [Mycobacteroides abscessus subsp. abscessus]|nr:transcriptional regulator [Mycobacteroides abscessus subsp. abscessus]
MTTNLLDQTTPLSKTATFRNSVPDSTGDSGSSSTRVPEPTPISALKHTSDARELVSRVDTLNADIRNTHTDALTHELSVRVQQRVKDSPQSMLEKLGDMGFSWRAVAQLVNVSVPALQKWRRGEGVSGENRRKLASLLAGIDIIASQFTVQEIESWFETPIVDNLPVTPISIWTSGGYVLVLRYASEDLTPEAVLEAFEPAWRTRWETSFEAVRAEDGYISLDMKG